MSRVYGRSVSTTPLPDRLHVSLRLKAARFLRGGADERGRAIAMTTKALAAHPALKANDISSNRLEEFEQLKTDARPMELAVLVQALDLPADWFSAASDRRDEERLQDLLHQANALTQRIARRQAADEEFDELEEQRLQAEEDRAALNGWATPDGASAPGSEPTAPESHRESADTQLGEAEQKAAQQRHEQDSADDTVRDDDQRRQDEGR